MGLKRTEKTKITIGDYDFYVSKFGAFKSANLSGELVRLFTPIIASIVPAASILLGNDDESTSVLDKEIDKGLESVAPALAGAFNNLSGKQVEELMRKLLIEERNISFIEKNCMDSDKVKIMEWEDADELFCGELQDMYQLAIKVIQLNYKGFFTKIAAQYGLDLEKVGAAIAKSKSMAPLMEANFAN